MPQCEGITKSGGRCSNNAQSGSTFCGIHSSDKAKPKKGERIRKTDLRCTYCGSTSVKAFPQIYLGGWRGGGSGAFVTSRGSVGVGTSGQYLTPAAQSVAPPGESHSFGYNFVSSIGILLALGSCTAAANRDSFGAGIILFIIIATLTYLLAGSLSGEIEKQKVEKQKINDWENSYRCSRCGHEFIWRKY